MRLEVHILWFVFPIIAKTCVLDTAGWKLLLETENKLQVTNKSNLQKIHDLVH